MSWPIISFDENGQPVIAHAFWNRKNQNGSKRDFKYFQKIKEGLKTRYFYSKEEWDAYQRAKSHPKSEVKSQSTAQVTKSAPVGYRPTSRKKNITGTAKSGSIYIRGKGLGTGPVGNNDIGYKSKKEKEYAEAVSSLVDYKQKQTEAKRARKATRENFSEYIGYTGLTALAIALGDFGFAKKAIFMASNTKRDLNASSAAKKKANQEQFDAAKKFFKETSDFAVEVVKDSTKKKANQVIDKYKSTSIKVVNQATQSIDTLLDTIFDGKK